jgi:imidazolonepropionase-like amidohydrolase
MNRTRYSKASLILVPVLVILLAGPLGQIERRRSFVLEHVTIIDVTGGPPKLDMSLLIVGDMIVSIGANGTLSLPGDAYIVDLSGKYVIPGLWDMHVHALQANRVPRYFHTFVDNGVLGICDMGSPLSELDNIIRWRNETADGRLLGPRIVAAGPIVDGAVPMFPNISIGAGSESDGRQIVDMLKARGVDFIKVYSGIDRDTYFAIAEEARAQSIPFAGHVPDSVTAAEASDAGQKSIEHLSGILLACSTEEGKIRQDLIEAAATKDSLLLFQAMKKAQSRLWETYSKEKAAALFSRFVGNGTWQVPTLAVAWGFLSAIGGTAVTTPERAYSQPLAVAQEREHGPCDGTLTGDYVRSKEGKPPRVFRLVADMRRAGVEFLAGTDAPSLFIMPGTGLHKELELFVRAGFTPLEALQTATLNPARYLGLQDRLGTVEEGKIADLVILDENPLDSISNTQKIYAVVLHGKLILPSELRAGVSDAKTELGK